MWYIILYIITMLFITNGIIITIIIILFHLLL